MQSIKHHILLTVALIGTAIGVVALLAWQSNKFEGDTTFYRALLSKKAGLVNVLNETEITDLAGQLNGRFYFKTKNINKLISTDRALSDKKEVMSGIPFNQKYSSSFNCIVDSGGIHILVGRLPVIAIANNMNSPKVYKFPKNLFTRSAKLPGDSYVFRVFDERNQIFIKGNAVTNEILQEKNISEKTNDAGISTDGSLHYDLETNSILYVFFHSSEFICMDTNMNLKYRKPTIESAQTLKLKVASVGSNNALTNTSPKRSIHGTSSTYRGYLYINSKITGQDKDTEYEKSSSIIDIYNIANGESKGSFYIPGYKGEKMVRFKICDNLVIAFYKDYVITYSLPGP